MITMLADVNVERRDKPSSVCVSPAAAWQAKQLCSTLARVSGRVQLPLLTRHSSNRKTQCHMFCLLHGLLRPEVKMDISSPKALLNEAVQYICAHAHHTVAAAGLRWWQVVQPPSLNLLDASCSDEMLCLSLRSLSKHTCHL